MSYNTTRVERSMTDDSLKEVPSTLKRDDISKCPAKQPHTRTYKHIHKHTHKSKYRRICVGPALTSA